MVFVKIFLLYAQLVTILIIKIIHVYNWQMINAKLLIT